LFTLDDRHSLNVQTFAEVETLPGDTDCERNNEKDDVGKNLCCLTRHTEIQCIFSKIYESKKKLNMSYEIAQMKTTNISFLNNVNDKGGYTR